MGNTVIACCRLRDELLEQFEDYVRLGQFTSRSEALRDLIIRGLFIQQKPHGSFREPAYISARYSFMAAIHRAARKRLLDDGGVDNLAALAVDDAAKLLGFDRDPSA